MEELMTKEKKLAGKMASEPYIALLNIGLLSRTFKNIVFS